MDGVLMGMIPLLCNHVRDIMDGDDAVEQHHDHEEQQEERKVVEEGITHDSLAGELTGRERSSCVDEGQGVPSPRAETLELFAEESSAALDLGVHPVGLEPGAC